MSGFQGSENQKVLSDAADVQDKTKQSVLRIQKQAAETESIGAATLEELRRQGNQMDEINTDLDNVSAKLDVSAGLQDKFDRWAGNWFGGKKREAMKDAAAEIALRYEDDLAKIKEVYEQEKFDSLARKWRPVGMVLCSNPLLDAPDIFDPKSELNGGEMATNAWMIDYSQAGIDAEGWTYDKNFEHLNKKGVGKPTSKWNSYVRRRKWKYHEKRSATNSALNEIKERNAARSNNNNTSSASQGDKVGYVPRNRQAGMTASGLSSGGMMGRAGKKEELDPESVEGLAKIKADDAEIDAGLDQIGGVLDNLTGIAQAMQSEVSTQSSKLERMDNSMQLTAEKQSVVNARQKKLVQSS
jgi:hypothetical protein